MVDLFVEPELMPAREVQVGDRILLPKLGYHSVVRVDHDDHIGMQPIPCIRIIYACGVGAAWENKASAPKGAKSFPRTEAGTVPYQLDELVPIHPRSTA